MPHQVTEQDQVKLAHAARWIHTVKKEAEQANRGLELHHEVDDETLRAMIENDDTPRTSRLTALTVLVQRHRRNPSFDLAQVLVPLWNDPDEELAKLAISATPHDEKLRATLRALLDDPRPSHWSTAASVLAQRNDTEIIPQLIDWFRNGVQTRRNVAWSCLYFNRLLDAKRCQDLLLEAWEAGGRDDDDRAMLAIGLLGFGNQVGMPFLVDLARRADNQSACWAAETILEQDPSVGLDLILHILDEAKSFEVLWAMVERIARPARLQHLWTADGLAEARNWILQEKTKFVEGGPKPHLRPQLTPSMRNRP
jgi:HEAT repeat protein